MAATISKLSTGAATVTAHHGVAMESQAQDLLGQFRYTQQISYANLDGSGSSDLDATGLLSSTHQITIDSAAALIY